MSEFVTFKRWTLRKGRKESELVELVRGEIVPHYMKLPGCLKLGLLQVSGTRSYLALQHWESRERWRATTSSEYYKIWYRAYVPILKRWDDTMAFEEEWETEELLGTSSGWERCGAEPADREVLRSKFVRTLYSSDA